MEGSAALQTLPPVTPSFAHGPVDCDRVAMLERLERVEGLLDQHRYVDALGELDGVAVPRVSAPDLVLRVLLAESWARLYVGELEQATAVADRARVLADGRVFTDADRAAAMFALGCCRRKLGKITNAISLFTSALALAERGAGARTVRLRARILEWRSNCYQVQREWEAAQADAERSLELAEEAGDGRAASHALMQCSLVAERRGDALTARLYAERAHALADETGDRQLAARALNNLGGLSFLLGEAETAVSYLKDSFALSLELGNDADAAQAVSSLAQVHLRCGAPQLAEEQARHALSILDDRDDYVDERGNAHLVLGRALLEQGRVDEAMREFAAAEWLFERFGSPSHVAAAWTAQGDAYRRSGDDAAALDLYRRAVDALQDFRF
ncbi:MAG TPA: tetratricopeptide repeat protein [Gaiellaceae bacterium]|nr:tetratricopeptide repeat protein [Gaiellaceae bacterium]